MSGPLGLEEEFGREGKQQDSMMTLECGPRGAGCPSRVMTSPGKLGEGVFAIKCSWSENKTDFLKC